MDTVTNVPKNAVCGLDGKPILFECLGDLNRCIVLVAEYLGYELEHARLDNDCHALIPASGFRQHVLSIPERASIATLAWHSQEYGAGLKLGESFTLPITGISDDIDGGFADEGRAYEFAQVVETVFERPAHVIETQYGWSVVVGAIDAPLNGEILAQLRGACRVLMSYPVGDYDDVFGGNTAHETYPDDKARQAWHNRKSAQQQRIEDGINAILAHLGHPEAPGRESVPAASRNAATGAKGRGIESLIPAGKKSSPKRSA